jgi:hypothetical protein
MQKKVFGQIMQHLDQKQGNCKAIILETEFTPKQAERH